MEITNYTRRMAEGEKDPRMYFAAERTFLAWIRTGLGLMGIGFAVARFGLFLRQIQNSQIGSQINVQLHAPVHGSGVSVYSGTALVGLGVLVNLGAMVHHVKITRELQSGTWQPRVSHGAVSLAAVLAVVGLAMGMYLLLLR